MLALQCTSGGFTETPRQGLPHTSATAAAMSVLLMENRRGPTLDGAAEFLGTMQSDTGGLRAHPEAGQVDLLSTFTGLVAITMSGHTKMIDLSKVARFLRTVAHPGGGFGAHAGDRGADVEYAYYGLGCLAICRGAVQRGEHSRQ